MSAFEFAAFPGHAPVQRRKMSREAAVAIGVSVLVHVGVVGYIATQKFTELTLTSPSEPPAILIESFLPPKPPPPQKTVEKVKPLNPIKIHETTPIVDTRVPPIAAVVQPDVTPTGDPPAIPQEIAPPKPVQLAELRSEPKPRVIRNPTWLRRPTGAELGRLYPERAIAQNLSGAATLMCEVVANGSVRNCAVIDESPKGRGFGEAALASARLFKLNPRTEDGEPVEGAKVRIPLVFSLAD